MGGHGFGQGVVEGMQQAQNRSLQMQQLKLQQDLAKFQQKHMETQDQMQQLQMQSFQQKIMQEQQAHEQRQALPGQISALTQPTLGANDMGPEPDIDRHKLTSLLLSAQQAGQDPEQLLSLMSLGDPRIAAIRQSLQPKKVGKVGEGEKLVDETTGKVIAEGGPKGQVISPGATFKREGQPDFVAPAAPAKPPDFGDRTESAASIYLKKQYNIDGGTMADLIKLDPVEAKKLRDVTLVEEPSIIQAGNTRAKIAEQENRVLHPSEANELGVPFGTTQKQATGVMPITAQQREALAHYDTARVIIGDIKQYSEKVNTSSGGLKGKLEQAGKLWGAYTQSDTNAALLMSKAGELASVARSLGEKGALANQDVARAAALIPSVLETREVAQRKISDMMKIINEGESNYRKSLGIDARAPGKSKAAPPVKPPAQDPLASIAVPPGLTPAQEDAWRQHYAKQREELKRQMAPKAQAKK